VDGVGAQGAVRGGVWGEGGPCLPRKGSGEGTRSPLQKIFLSFDLKMEHFGAVFKLDLMEKKQERNCKMRRQLPPLASYWLRLSTHYPYVRFVRTASGDMQPYVRPACVSGYRRTEGPCAYTPVADAMPRPPNNNMNFVSLNSLHGISFCATALAG